MKILSFIVALIIAYCSLAQDKYYRPSKHFPIEFHYLINSLQSIKMTKEQRTLFTQKIKSFDQFASHITKERMHLFVKSEIYKIIFKNRPKITIDKKLYKKKIINIFQKRIESLTQDEISPFTFWFIEALSSDLKIFFASKHFKQIEAVIFRDKSFRNDKERNLKKKLDLTLCWVQLFMNISTEEFEDRLTEIMHLITNRIEKYSNLYLTLIPPKKLAPHTKIKYFSVTEKAPEKKGISYINYLLDLKNMGIEHDRQNRPKIEWLPKDEPDNLVLPPNSKKDKPIHSSKEKPIPINDWQIDIE